MKYEVELNGKKYEVEVEEGEARLLSVSAAAPATVSSPAAPVAAPAAAPVAAPAASSASGAPVKAPMPGNVLKLCFANGDTVKSGDTVLILEAMKMENEIAAPVGGTIKYIASKGSTVDTDAVLAVIA